MLKDNPVRCFTSLRDRRRTEALSDAQTWFSQQSPLLDDREPKPSLSLWQSAFLKLWLVTPGLVTDLFLVGTHDKTTSCFYVRASVARRDLTGQRSFGWMVKIPLTWRKYQSVAFLCQIKQCSLIQAEYLEEEATIFLMIDYFWFSLSLTNPKALKIEQWNENNAKFWCQKQKND